MKKIVIDRTYFKIGGKKEEASGELTAGLIMAIKEMQRIKELAKMRHEADSISEELMKDPIDYAKRYKEYIKSRGKQRW